MFIMHATISFGVGVLWAGDSDSILGAQDAIAFLRDQVRVRVDAFRLLLHLLG